MSLALDAAAQGERGARGPAFPMAIAGGEEEGHLARCSISLSLEPCGSGRRASVGDVGGGGNSPAAAAPFSSGTAAPFSSGTALSVLALDMDAVAAVAGPAAVAAADEARERKRGGGGGEAVDKRKNMKRLRMRHLASLGLLQRDIAGAISLDGGVRIALLERQWRQA